MYNIIDHANHDAGVLLYVVDTYEEMWTLAGRMGSRAICLEDMNTYIKDGRGSWRLMPRSSGGSSEAMNNTLDSGVLEQLVLS